MYWEIVLLLIIFIIFWKTNIWQRTGSFQFQLLLHLESESFLPSTCSFSLPLTHSFKVIPVSFQTWYHHTQILDHLHPVCFTELCVKLPTLRPTYRMFSLTFVWTFFELLKLALPGGIFFFFCLMVRDVDPNVVQWVGRPLHTQTEKRKHLSCWIALDQDPKCKPPLGETE